MRRGLLLGIVVLVLATISMGDVSANSRQAYREAIRSMPLLERPNRFGHFYGNTVRRLYHRRHGDLPNQQMETPGVETLPLQPTPANVQ